MCTSNCGHYKIIIFSHNKHLNANLYWITASRNQFKFNSNDVLQSPSKSENIALFSIPCRSAVTFNILLFHCYLRMAFAASPAFKLGDSVSPSCCKWSRKPNSAGVERPCYSFFSKIKAAMDLPPIPKSGFSFWKLFCFRINLLSDVQGLKAQKMNGFLITSCNQTIIEKEMVIC